MLSKNRIKLIKSLSQKKYRQQLGFFTVEGIKGIKEFLNSTVVLEALYTIDDVFEADKKKTHKITKNELQRISFLKTPNTALAIFNIPKSKSINKDGLKVVLDDVRDPGNLGTIIRLCDWYGVKDLVCSINTVDFYNSKVVQASMGSLARVNISYLDLEVYLDTTTEKVYGTFVKGETIYKTKLPKSGIVVMGNEAKGISKIIESKVHHKITIPQYGERQNTESLNVANATAIVLSEFRRSFIEM